MKLVEVAWQITAWHPWQGLQTQGQNVLQLKMILQV
jgi:hypothetical protein